LRLTGGQIVAEYLAREGVPYVLAIPGHGNAALLDAFVDRDDIRVLPVVHEQCATHIADAYYRVSGQPLVVSTSIGPGAVNAASGLAQCYVDSIAVLLITGSVHTYMRGRAVLQEIERDHWANFPRMVEPVVKRWWQPSRVDQLPYVLHRAFSAMLTGRRGPALIDLPMDLQAEAADVEIPEPHSRRPSLRARPDGELLERAARLLRDAKRPAIVAGGGAHTSGAGREIVALAELLGAPIATTWQGKGVVPEDHELYAWHPGDIGASCANELLRAADIVLAVGYRFVDWTASSYRSGVTYRFPDSKLVQIDVDPQEIGKNYPVEVGIVADAKDALADLVAWLQENGGARDWRDSEYHREIRRAVDAWWDSFADRRDANDAPVSISRALRDLRGVLDRDGIVVTGAGLPQSQVYQEFPVYEPHTHVTSGGFSTMGFTVPAAIGAKLAAPGRQVVGVAGDGDFAMNVQELATAMQLGLSIVYLVLNNYGWQSINNLQKATFGRELITRFRTPDGRDYSPDFTRLAEAYGCQGERVESPDGIIPALERAFAADRPAIVEVMCATEGPLAQLSKVGWWDVPIPAYMEEKRKQYERERSEVSQA
jgi:acetolactate synthase-1/2/3 large subunit